MPSLPGTIQYGVEVVRSGETLIHTKSQETQVTSEMPREET